MRKSGEQGRSRFSRRKTGRDGRFSLSREWKRFLQGFLSFAAGALILCSVATVQKVYANFPFVWQGYVVPFFFGGAFGWIIGVLFFKLARRTNQLKRILAERKRLDADLVESEERLRVLIDAIPDIVCFKDGDGRRKGLVVAGRDAADRMAAEKAIAYHSQILSAVRDAIVVISPEMKTIWCNQTAKEIYGDRPEMFAEHCFTFYKHRESACEKCPVLKVMADGKSHQEVSRSYDKDNNLVWRLNKAYPFYDEQGKIAGAIEIVSDYSEQKRLLDALEKSEFVLNQAQAVAGVGSWRQDIVENVFKYESEERLDLAIRGTNAGLWDWHVRTGRVVFNERWAEIAGYALDELEPASIRTWIDLCHPDDLKLSDELLKRHFSGETDFYECEARMKRKDGSWVWVLDRGRVTQWGDDGKPVRMTGTHVDITDRKRYEELVHAERDMASAWSVAGGFAERLAVCLETAIRVSSMDSGGIYLADETDGSMRLAVHRGVSDFFVENASHYPADSTKVEMIRKGEPVYTLYRNLTSRENVPVPWERLQAIAVVPILFQGRVVGCLNVASHTEDRVPEHARVALERIARYAGSFIAHEMQEEKIRQGWKDLDAFFNTIEDLVFILDTDGIIIGHNKVAADRLGYPANELTGRHVLEVHPEDRGREAQAVIEAMIAGETATCSIPVKTRDGRFIPVETNVVVGRWKGRDVIFGISRDMTERDRLEASRLSLEQRRQQVEKAESLSRMAGAVAHHFNNILAVVMGNLELALNKLPDDDIAKLIGDAEKAVHRATQISGYMLSFIGMTRGKPQTMDFSKTIREHLPAIQTELPAIIVESDLPESGPAIDADPEKIRQILAILVANAWESMKGASGAVRISVDAWKASEIRKSRCFPVQWNASADAYACLTVADTGCGMDKETIGRIFDPFYTDKFIGRGIGLPVTLGIVKSSGGCVMVESKPGAGSVFRVFWPVSSR